MNRNLILYVFFLYAGLMWQNTTDNKCDAFVIDGLSTESIPGKYVIYGYSTDLIKSPIPSPPFCKIKQKENKLVGLLTVGLWRLNQQIKQNSAYLLRERIINTKCDVAFFGTQEKTKLKDGYSPVLQNLPTDWHQWIQEQMKTMPTGEVRTYNNPDLYECSWLQSREKETKILELQHIVIEWTVEGTIIAPFNTKACKFFSSVICEPSESMRLVVASTLTQDLCPYDLIKVVPAVWSSEGLANNIPISISIPDLKRTFWLNQTEIQRNGVCTKDNLKLLKTTDGYLISVLGIQGQDLSQLKITFWPKRDQLTNPHIVESFFQNQERGHRIQTRDIHSRKLMIKSTNKNNDQSLPRGESEQQMSNSTTSSVLPLQQPIWNSTLNVCMFWNVSQMGEKKHGGLIWMKRINDSSFLILNSEDDISNYAEVCVPKFLITLLGETKSLLSYPVLDKYGLEEDLDNISLLSVPLDFIKAQLGQLLGRRHEDRCELSRFCKRQDPLLKAEDWEITTPPTTSFDNDTGPDSPVLNTPIFDKLFQKLDEERTALLLSPEFKNSSRSTRSIVSSLDKDSDGLIPTEDLESSFNRAELQWGLKTLAELTNTQLDKLHLDICRMMVNEWIISYKQIFTEPDLMATYITHNPYSKAKQVGNMLIIDQGSFLMKDSLTYSNELCGRFWKVFIKSQPDFYALESSTGILRPWNETNDQCDHLPTSFIVPLLDGSFYDIISDQRHQGVTLFDDQIQISQFRWDGKPMYSLKDFSGQDKWGPSINNSSPALNYIAEKVKHVPGYTFLGLSLGWIEGIWNGITSWWRDIIVTLSVIIFILILLQVLKIYSIINSLCKTPKKSTEEKKSRMRLV